jgi:hypothetical protein
LALYDSKKFSILHRIVLEDDGVPHLEKKMDDVTVFFECIFLLLIFRTFKKKLKVFSDETRFKTD